MNALNPELVATIADQVQGRELDESVVAALREAYPNVHFTYCMDDDIHSGKPVLSRTGFNVYLVDSREHCLCLTDDYDTASGMVLAETFDEE